MSFVRTWVVLAALPLVPAAVAAQHVPAHRHATRHASAAAHDSAVVALLDRARRATARYADRAIAVRDGYRRLGPDFPGMGEHWFNTALAFAGRFDPERPAMLSYATIGGVPRLVGVAWALPLLGTESPPAFPASDVWHDHGGTIDDEAFGEHGPRHEAVAGARISAMHAWIWLENPGGMFAADNWALPFVRAGLRPPREPPPTDAARMLSLASDAGGYWLRYITRRAGPEVRPSDSTAIAHALNGARDALALLVRQRSGEMLTDAEMTDLVARWHALWVTLGASVAPDLRDRVAMAKP